MTANDDWVRALRRTADLVPTGDRTLARILDEQAAAAPDHPALEGEDGALSYAGLTALVGRCAGWALALEPGARVALMMANAPAYPAVWLGLSRVGVVTALLGAQLRGASLAHCLAAAGATCVVADEAGAAALREAGWRGAVLAPETLAAHDPAPLAALAARAPRLRDTALLIYTSGTTGLPKPARVSHLRVATWSEWFAGLIDARSSDRLFNCLPLSHSVGGVVAVGCMLAAGGTVVLRRGFSASRFWPDVAASRATIFQYIGELPRFLAAAPPHPDERRHHLRLALGNGLQEAPWRALTQRFAVPRVVEFYAATEGSFSLFNVEGRVGALGRVPGFMAHRSPVALVRVDEDGAPLRGPDGFCLRCGPDEPGEAVGRLDTDGAGFEGYAGAPEASAAKLLRNAFAPGDAWYRTGDLLRRDAQGFFFFVDRLGDAFRWRGENVSAGEVAAVLRRAPGVADAAVYGVAVPGSEGRAGMAALVAGEGFDLAALAAHLARDLPRYARPLFLRLRGALDATATFRPQTAALRAEGFDPALCGGDPLFLAGEDGYAPLDGATHARLAAGTLRL